MDDKMEETLSEKIALFVREKRKALGMSQKQFAVHLFNDPHKQGWVHKIENGRPINVATLGKILDGLNADFEIIEY